MAKYYFIRHAESVANAAGIYQGQTYDTGLSDRGKIQAKLLGDNFKNDIGCVVTSPLARTRATATELIRTTQATLLIEPAILETNHGLWEGKHKVFIQQTWPKMYKTWQETPAEAKFPKGESFRQTQKRIIDWWNNFNLNKDAAIVTHDNIIRIVIADVLNVGLNDIWKFNLLPTAITTIEKCNHETKVIELNNNNHLDDELKDISAHAM